MKLAKYLTVAAVCAALLSVSHLANASEKAVVTTNTTVKSVEKQDGKTIKIEKTSEVKTDAKNSDITSANAGSEMQNVEPAAGMPASVGGSIRADKFDYNAE